MPVELLPWDTAHFGFPIGRVTGTCGVEDVVRADAMGLECVYWLVDAADDRGIAMAQRTGFRLVDVRVTLESNIPSSVRDDPNAYVVRPSDLPQLCELASVSHQDSRFFVDGNFDEEWVRLMFYGWLLGSSHGDRTVLAYYWNGVPVGYCACVCHGNIGNIDLLGVAETHREHGVGRALVQAALQWFRGQGMITATVITQGRNVAVQRLYQRCGFITKSVGLWYHRWRKEQGK